MKLKSLLNLFIFSLLIVSCSSESSDFVPKPKGFNHIDLPAHEYTKFKEEGFPYTFEISKHAIPENDSVLVEKKKFYKTISYPKLGYKIHITYKDIKQNEDTLRSYIAEGYKLRDGHDKKAYGFNEQYAQNANGDNVAIFEIEGNVPSQYQFMLHDSTDNFMRGVLYFPIATKNDSLAPVIQYAKEDIQHLINTVEWVD